MSIQIMQFNPACRTQERRQKSSPVWYNRRSGMDRRQVNKPVFTSINKLKSNVDRLDKSTLGTQQAVLYALSPLPPARRISSLPNTLEDKNFSRAGLLLGMAAANFPRDLEEIGRAYKEGINIYKKGLSETEFCNAQRSFHLLKGTIVEKWAKKYPKFKNIYKRLNKADKALYDTNFGKFSRNIFNIKEPEVVKIKSSGFGVVKEKGFQFSGNYLQKIIGKALFRLSVLSVATTALMEIPALLKSTTKGDSAKDKTKSFFKQLCKSAGYVTLVSAGIAIAGAMVAPSLIASLIGMGVGASLGLIASKTLNKQIDKVIT